MKKVLIISGTVILLLSIFMLGLIQYNIEPEFQPLGVMDKQSDLNISDEVDIFDYVTINATSRGIIVEDLTDKETNYKVIELENGQPGFDFTKTYNKKHTYIDFNYPVLIADKTGKLKKYKENIWHGMKLVLYEEYIDLSSKLKFPQKYNNKNWSYVMIAMEKYTPNSSQITDIKYNEETNTLTAYVFYNNDPVVHSYANQRVLIIPINKIFPENVNLEMINLIDENIKSRSYIPNFESLDKSEKRVPGCIGVKDYSIECYVNKAITWGQIDEFKLEKDDEFNYGVEVMLNGEPSYIFCTERPWTPRFLRVTAKDPEWQARGLSKDRGKKI